MKIIKLYIGFFRQNSRLYSLIILLVIKMKFKFVFPLILAILIGFFSAKAVYGLYNYKEEPINNSYFLQQGVYKNLENVKSSTKDIENYIIEEKEDKYYVYVGITTKMENANRIKKIYKDKDIDLYIKEAKIDNEEFYNNLEQYDVLLSGVSKSDDVLSISKVILSSYEEMVLTN